MKTHDKGPKGRWERDKGQTKKVQIIQEQMAKGQLIGGQRAKEQKKKGQMIRGTKEKRTGDKGIDDKGAKDRWQKGKGKNRKIKQNNYLPKLNLGKTIININVQYSPLNYTFLSRAFQAIQVSSINFFIQ